MLASPSLSDRKTLLETIIRRALASGRLSREGLQQINEISTQQDLNPAECKMLEILQDALQAGAIQQGR
jgi:hypothetical protein